jgi:phage gp36-like protein
LAWITEADIKPFIHDWDSYGFTVDQINGAIENAEARVKDRLAPYFTLPADDETPPAGLKSLIAQYAAYLLMRARRVALTEAEEAWVKELGDEVENMLDDIVQGNRAIKGLVRHAIEGGEEPSYLHDLVDPLIKLKKKDKGFGDTA